SFPTTPDVVRRSCRGGRLTGYGWQREEVRRDPPCRGDCGDTPYPYSGFFSEKERKSSAGSGFPTNSTHVRTSFSTLRRWPAAAWDSNIGVRPSPINAFCRS